MSLQRQLLIIALCGISAVALLQAGFLSLQRFLIQPSQHPALAATTVQNDDNHPVAVSIPHKAGTLPIYPSSIQNGEWSISDQGVSLLKYGNDHERGHILYGHNWSTVLGQLDEAKIGDEIALTYQNGELQTYEISSMFTVPANRLDVLAFAEPQKLLIYTCSGFLDTKRLVVIATLKTEALSQVTKLHF